MRVFGNQDGRDIREVELVASGGGIAAKIIEHGAVVRDLHVRRGDGAMQRVVLGFETLDDYVAHSPHAGALAGRYANRIAKGRFTLDGRTYQLPLNENGRTALHGGGPTGFGKRPWSILAHDAASVTLGHVSPDGDNGFPGAMSVTCRYTLAGTATLRVELAAIADAPTIVNLAQHTYFNLDGGSDILDHTMEIASDFITPIDADLIPTGEMRAVAGTPWDFRIARPIRRAGSDGRRFWYDHNWMLRRDRTEPTGSAGLIIAHAATLHAPKSGLTLETWTSEPALQFYDGFKLAPPVAGLDGVRYGANAGLCLEAQHCPDSPNHPQFPSTVLRPDTVYRQTTEYRFV